MSDITLQPVTSRRYNIIRRVKFNFEIDGEQMMDYDDIVGTLRHVANTTRRRIAKTQPEHYWQVTLDTGDRRDFVDKDEAIAWLRAVLELA